MNLIVLGAGTYAVEVTDIAEDLGHNVECYVVNVPVNTKILLGKSIYQIDEISSCKDFWAIGAIISTERERLIEEIQSLKFEFASLIHPSASVSKTAKIGNGVTVNRNAVIGSHAEIGNHVIINRGCLIGHHVQLGDYVTMGPGVNIAGSCKIGNKVFIGMGAQIFPNVIIPDNSVVSAGTTIAKWTSQ